MSWTSDGKAKRPIERQGFAWRLSKRPPVKRTVLILPKRERKKGHVLNLELFASPWVRSLFAGASGNPDQELA